MTPSELWNNAEGKEILTQENQYSAKNIPVIPRFYRFRRSPLAGACIVQCPKKNKRLLAV